MFEKITQLAEAAATHVSLSRRGFMGRLGQGAIAVGALLGSFTVARAGSGVVCCKYSCSGLYKGHYQDFACLPQGSTCRPTTGGSGGFCKLTHQFTASDCTRCS